MFINPNPLTGFAVLRLIREAIGLDNQRTKLLFQYSQVDARNDGRCAISDGNICTQLYELWESTNGVSKSRNSPTNVASFGKHRSDWLKMVGRRKPRDAQFVLVP